MRAGQEREIYSNLVGDRQELQQLPRLPHKVQRQRAKKSGLEGVGAGDSKKKGLSILFLGQSTHWQKADTLSFPSRGRPPPTFYPITLFPSLGAKKKIGYCRGTVVLHTQYPARVTTRHFWVPHNKWLTTCRITH